MSAVADKLRQQLIAEKAFYKYDYGNSALDPWLTDQLVSMLESKGITDIRNIAFFDGVVPYITSDGRIDYSHTSYFWDAATGKIIDGMGGVIDPDPLKTTFATLANDDYLFTFWVRYTPQRVPYFLIQLKPRQQQSLWMQVREVLPVIMAVVTLAVPGLGATIGQAVLGPLASTYPAVASTIGRVAVSAASNGGDIQKAVVGALAQFPAAQVGDIVSNFSGVEAIGNAAASATSAAITGADLKTSVGLSLLQSGASSGISAFQAAPAPEPVVAPSGEPMATDQSILDMFGITQEQVDAGAPVSIDTSYPNVDVFGTTPDIFNPTAADPYSGLNVDMSGVNLDLNKGFGNANGPTITAGESGVAQTTDSSGVNWDKVVQNVSQVAIAALKVLPAFVAAGRPAVRIGSTATNGDGSTTTYSANGTVTTHYPNGQVSTKPTPTGQPYFLNDGSTITNNGDGTYTVIRPDGKVATMNYSAAAMSSTWLLYGALGLGAVLMLSRR